MSEIWSSSCLELIFNLAFHFWDSCLQLWPNT